jgi:pimeloyl-ACP methyl ester carboxylesterase
MPKSDYVIILHGILLGKWHLSRLAHFLDSHGYEVINLDYPSTKYSMNQLIELINEQIKQKKLDDSRTVHFVGYSLGGLLVRGLIAGYRPNHVGCVVQIGPPNHGSEVADFLKRYVNPLFLKICGPAGQELVTDISGEHFSSGVVDYPLGIIAGNASISPFSSWIIPGEDDGKVSVESTKLDGMTDHLVLPVSHIFLPLRSSVHEKVLFFLKKSRFHSI